MPDLHDRLVEEARLTEYLDRKSRERREQRRRETASRTKTRKKPPGRRAKTTPPMAWLRSLTCSLVYGEATPDGVRPSNTIKQLQDRWSLNYHLRKLANYQFGDHFGRAGTFYFFGNGSPKAGRTLVMIDIDVQKSLDLGTTAGAVAFASHLKNTQWPDLYFEPSTGGNGVHGYLVVEKLGAGAAAVNDGLKRLQDWLRAEAERVKADIELVEIKGTCPEIEFRYGAIESVRYGTFAKLPRDVSRFSEWRSTTVLTLADLRSSRFDVTTRVAETAEPAAGVCSVQPRRAVKPTPGSVSGRLISAERLAAIPRYEAFAGELTGGKPLTAQKWQVTDHDFAVALLLLRFFHDNPNPDGTLPTERVKGMWAGLYSAGDVRRPWNHHRWKAIRDFLSAQGHIHWTDHRYEYGSKVGGKYVKGVACKFTITETFATALDRVASASSTVAGTPGGASFVDIEIKKMAPRRGAGRFLVPTRFPIRAENEMYMLKRAFEACEHLCAA